MSSMNSKQQFSKDEKLILESMEQENKKLKKQKKKVKEENQKLKEENEKLKKQKKKVKKDNQKLNEENEKLKEEIEKIKHLLMRIQAVSELLDEEESDEEELSEVEEGDECGFCDYTFEYNAHGQLVCDCDACSDEEYNHPNHLSRADMLAMQPKEE